MYFIDCTIGLCYTFLNANDSQNYNLMNENGERNMKKNSIRSILCILIAIIIAFSFVYVNSKGDHICIGEQCHVCIELNTCKLFLRNLFYCAVFIVLSIYIYGSLKKIKIDTNPINKPTPVSLKVKLTN